MWYRKAQAQTDGAAPAAPAPVTDQTALSAYQIQINNILAATGKTYSEIIIDLTNLKTSINSNENIDKATKAAAASTIENYITTITTQGGANLNAPYTPQVSAPTALPTQTEQAADPNNPTARFINTGNAVAPSGTGGLLGPNQINNRNLPPPPPAPGSPAQNTQQQQAPAAKPGKNLYMAIKAAGINNFIFEKMPADVLPLDDRSFEMVKNNLISSKSLNPGAIATLKSLLAAMGIYLTVDNNVMVFSKEKTEASPKPQSTFDTVPYKDEK